VPINRFLFDLITLMQFEPSVYGSNVPCEPFQYVSYRIDA